MICRKCGKPILSLAEYAEPHECRTCHNKQMRAYGRRDYMREYMRTRRWLDGADRTDDLGEPATTYLTHVYDSAGIRHAEIRDKATRRQIA